MLIKSLVTFHFTVNATSFIPMEELASKQELLNHGKSVYQSRCLGCHGQKGDGKGPASLFLDPKPRDFTSGIYIVKLGGRSRIQKDGIIIRVFLINKKSGSRDSSSLSRLRGGT